MARQIREPHTDDHGPVAIIYACLRAGCGKTTFKVFKDGRQIDSLTAYKEQDVLRTLVSFVREEIAKQGFDL